MTAITESTGSSAGLSEGMRIVRSRRRSVWWEPIFDESLATEITRGDWILPENAADKRVFFADDFRNCVNKRSLRKTFDGARFKKCDFSGAYTQENSGLVFKDCEFINCDFGTSTWEGFKFSRCIFRECSFTQSTWINGEFRDCTWQRISASGNETKLDSVIINNPECFIDAMTTNLDDEVLKSKKANKSDQIMSLCSTKSTVARNIFFNHKTRGDDNGFYRSLKKYIVETDRAKRKKHKSTIRNDRGMARIIAYIRYAISCLESAINSAFGYVTNWGGSSARPFFGLFTIWVLFGGLYWLFFCESLLTALSISFDVTSIAGFTRSVPLLSSRGYRIVTSMNLLSAIFFYTAFFSVAISKISRVR